MDGRSDPDPSDGVCVADRRRVCLCIAVFSADASGIVHQTAVFSAAFDAFVSPYRQNAARDPVHPACRSADRRNGDASDTAIRRDGLCGRNDGGNGSAADCAAHCCLCNLHASFDPENAFGTQKTCTAYDPCAASCGTHVSMRCDHRQRKFAEGAGFRLGGCADRQKRRPAAVSCSIRESVVQWRTVRRTADSGSASAIRNCCDRLYLRKSAGTDRQSTGCFAGKSFTV